MTVIYRAQTSGWLAQTAVDSSQSTRRDLVLNTYFPDETNTGVLPDVPRTVVTSLTPKVGQTYENLDIRAVVTLPAASGTAKVVFRNCRFQGTAANPTSTVGLVKAANAGHAPAEFYDCTFQPQIPHFQWVGIQGYGYRIVRCAFRYLVDALNGFISTSGQQNNPTGITVYQSWVGKHAYWPGTVDTNHTDGSHSDGFQIMGGSGYDIQGNTFTGQLDPQWQPNSHGLSQANAALLIKSDVGQITGLNVQHNLLGGGGFTVNIANNTARPLGNIGTIANNAFNRDQPAGGRTLSMPSNVTGVFTGNVYADNGDAIVVNRNG